MQISFDPEQNPDEQYPSPDKFLLQILQHNLPPDTFLFLLSSTTAHRTICVQKSTDTFSFILRFLHKSFKGSVSQKSAQTDWGKCPEEKEELLR